MARKINNIGPKILSTVSTPVQGTTFDYDFVSEARKDFTAKYKQKGWYSSGVTTDKDSQEYKIIVYCSHELNAKLPEYHDYKNVRVSVLKKDASPADGK